MKKAIIFFISLIMIIGLVGCGDDEDKRLLFQDDGVSVVEEDTEAQDAQTKQELMDYDEKVKNSVEYETLDKDAYEAYMNSLPKDESGNLKVNDFSPEQQAMYNKFINGIYVTDFSAETVLSDIREFFGDDNLQRMKTVQYNESIDKRYGKEFNADEEKFQEITYTATVYENPYYRIVDGETTLRAGSMNDVYKYDFTVNYMEPYYYGFKKVALIDETNTYYFAEKSDKQAITPFKDFQKIFNEGCNNLIIEDNLNNTYECSFEVDPLVFKQTQLSDREYIEPIFNSKDNTDDSRINGRVWVDYNDNVVTKVVLTQQVTEDNMNILTFMFNEYNTPENDKYLTGILTYEDARTLDSYIEKKKEEYKQNPHAVVADKPKDRIDAYYEQNNIVRDSEGNIIQGEITPDGMKALVDINGNRVLDSEGNNMYVYEDTFVPVNPNQIPMGTMTPIGDQPIEDGILQTIVGY